MNQTPASPLLWSLPKQASTIPTQLDATVLRHANSYKRLLVAVVAFHFDGGTTPVIVIAGFDGSWHL